MSGAHWNQLSFGLGARDFRHGTSDTQNAGHSAQDVAALRHVRTPPLWVLAAAAEYHRPAGAAHLFTTSTPFIPTTQWPGKLQRNGYSPGWAGTWNVTSPVSLGPSTGMNASTLSFDFSGT